MTEPASPLVGILFHAVGGLCSAIFYLPYKSVRGWAWETYWLVGGVSSWIIMPLIFAWLFVPNLQEVLLTSPPSSLVWSYVFGALWGAGGLTFGLTVRYLGIALGTSLALGYCAIFGTLLPPLFSGEFGQVVGTRSGMVVLGGIAICLGGIAITGIAGKFKESEQQAARGGESPRLSFMRGFGLAAFCGIMSACMSYGFAAGKPIAANAVKYGTAGLWQNMPVLVVVLWGGFTTNFIACMALNVRNGTLADYINGAGNSDDARRPMLLNYLYASLAGSIWYFQYVFYGMGTTKMGRYDFCSWTLHMATIIIFGTLVGVCSREWKGASAKTIRLMQLGLGVLVISTLVIGYGNYIAKPRGAQRGSGRHRKMTFSPLAYCRSRLAANLRGETMRRMGETLTGTMQLKTKIVKFQRIDGTNAVFVLESGNYRFAAPAISL